MKKARRRRTSSGINNTIYDDVFKAFVEIMPEYLIPVVNEVFKKNYADNEGITLLKDEHKTKNGTIITDLVFLIRDTKYHVELQAYPDGTMAIRMVEYDFAVAIGSAVKTGNEYDMEFPESCVLYIRHTKNTPDELTVKLNANGNTLTRIVPIIKIQDYPINEIFEKKLFVFLPYYIIRYEKALRKKEVSNDTIKQLADDYEQIYKNLSSELDENHNVIKNRIIEAILIIAEHIISMSNMDEKVKKGVLEIMGGHSFVFEVDKKLYAAEARGVRRGKRLGRASHSETVFTNMINRGYAVEEAIAISEISAKKQRKY